MQTSLKITLALIRRKYPDFEYSVFHNTPVTPLSKPLRECKLALVTTGGLHLKTDTPFDTKFRGGDCSYRILPDDVRHEDIMVTHESYDHKFINEDLNCVFPIDRMREFVSEGKIKSLSKEHYSFMGHIFMTGPLLENAVNAGHSLKENGVDIAFLTPGWVICNQSVGLIARGIEEAGLSTVCVTFRKDIIKLTRPPRILSLKFSPGKPLGNPRDRKMQRDIIEAGFDLLQRKINDMTTVDLPFRLKKFGLF